MKGKREKIIHLYIGVHSIAHCLFAAIRGASASASACSTVVNLLRGGVGDSL